MSAERLREAAKVLRDKARTATPGPWEVCVQDAQADMPPDYGIWMPEVAHDGALVETEDDADYIATVDPPFALAVADWLDDMALLYDVGDSGGPLIHRRALAVADTILGDPA